MTTMWRRYFAFSALAAFSSFPLPFSPSPSVSSSAPSSFFSSRRMMSSLGVVKSLVTSVTRSSAALLVLSRGIAHAESSASSSSSSLSSSYPISYLDAATAQKIDEDLMGVGGGFQLEQLMELAGLSVASAAQDMILSASQTQDGKNVLIICGPGNNGGDGLVAARHLKHLGHHPVILYPKQGKNPFYEKLCIQCRNLEIPVIHQLPSSFNQKHEVEGYKAYFKEFDLIIDSIFGFSFRGPARAPFSGIITALGSVNKNGQAVLSVDVPSGWSVNEGDVQKTGFIPNAVISLTAPKQCMRNFLGTHYLGGRFVPKTLLQKYDIELPEYDSASPTQIMKLMPPYPPVEENPAQSSEWVLLTSAEGFPYYYHPTSGESRWATLQPSLQPTDTPAYHLDQHARDAQSSSGRSSQDDDISMFVSTASGLSEAQSIANHLVRNRLAACVNIVPGVTSVYEWEGNVEEGTEAMMIIKTRSSMVKEVNAAIKKQHSYDVHEGIVVDLDMRDKMTGDMRGNSEYHKWVLEQTHRDKH